MRVSIASIVLAAVVAACASGEPAASTTTSAGTSTTTTSLATTTTPSAPTSTTTPEVDVEFVDGEADGPDVLEVELGETVDIWVLSDVDDEMHVHGYDIIHELEAGEPFNLSFSADVPGIFEVEVHTGHTLLFELQVSG